MDSGEYVASATTATRNPRSSRPRAECATQTSVSSPDEHRRLPTRRLDGLGDLRHVRQPEDGLREDRRSRRQGLPTTPSVGPFRSGCSSVTTMGTSSAAATRTSHAIRATTSAAFAAACSRRREEAWLDVDDDEDAVLALEQPRNPRHSAYG